MPLFPILETETVVQAKDKTRLDGSRSYASGVGPIAMTKITAGADGAELDVSADGFLDWEFDGLTFDVVEDVNDLVDFTLGGVEYAAVVAPDTYTPLTLAAAIAAAMENEVANNFQSAFEDDKITITGDEAFAFLGKSGENATLNTLLPQIGFAVDTEEGTEQESDVIEAYPKYVLLHVENDNSTLDPPSNTNDEAEKGIFVMVILERLDKLFSTDQKLKSRESDIMKYLADGRASFKNFHREAQTLIFEWLDRQGYIDDFQEKLTKAAIHNVDEVREWATMIALRLIFESVSNTTEDVFFRKARQYEKMEAFYRDKAVLRLDLNEDGQVDLGEQLDVQHAIVVRR